MHKVSGTCGFSSAGTDLLESLMMQDPVARLGSLRKEVVGSLLLVPQQYSSDSRPSEPYITAFTCYALSVLQTVNPPGITYSDFWDESVFAHYGLPPPVGLHCPVVAATKGFSCAMKLPGAVDLLTESQAMPSHLESS
jgi:hypothetical protein